MIPTRQQLEEGRHRGYSVYGYFWSFCELTDCCERCDRTVRFWCRVKCAIERVQTKRILRICKKEETE